MTENSASPALVHVTRGGVLESVHRGTIVVSDSSGRVISALGDPDKLIFLRSAAKPIQTLPVLESGAAKQYKLTSSELAVMCGSLNGQDFQVAAVRSILKKCGMDEALLDSGVHRPSHRPTANQLSKDGLKPLAVHNNCAGKHAAMLCLCAYYGWDPAGYVEIEHPVQKLILGRVSEMTDTAEDEIGIGLDGCGVPVFALKIKNLAYAYARLAEAANTGQPKESADLMAACLAHPEMIAGDDRICTEVMRAGEGKFLAKTGAEGTYTMALPDKGWGVAVSIEDGSPRAINPVVVELLIQLGQLDKDQAAQLSDLHRPQVKNHRQQVVGGIEPVFHLNIDVQ